MKRYWIRFLARLPFWDATVLIEDGRAEAKRGAVQSRLLAELSELAKSNGISSACVHARKNGNGFMITLCGVPETLHQRFRNVWGANYR